MVKVLVVKHYFQIRAEGRERFSEFENRWREQLGMFGASMVLTALISDRHIKFVEMEFQYYRV